MEPIVEGPVCGETGNAGGRAEQSRRPQPAISRWSRIAGAVAGAAGHPSASAYGPGALGVCVLFGFARIVKPDAAGLALGSLIVLAVLGRHVRKNGGRLPISGLLCAHLSIALSLALLLANFFDIVDWSFFGPQDDCLSGLITSLPLLCAAWGWRLRRLAGRCIRPLMNKCRGFLPALPFVAAGALFCMLPGEPPPVDDFVAGGTVGALAVALCLCLARRRVSKSFAMAAWLSLCGGYLLLSGQILPAAQGMKGFLVLAADAACLVVIVNILLYPLLTSSWSVWSFLSKIFRLSLCGGCLLLSCQILPEAEKSEGVLILAIDAACLVVIVNTLLTSSWFLRPGDRPRLLLRSFIKALPACGMACILATGYGLFLLTSLCKTDRTRFTFALAKAGLYEMDRKEYVYNLMKDRYLWYDKMPAIDPAVYKTPEDLFAAAKYGTIDKWSLMASGNRLAGVLHPQDEDRLGFEIKRDTDGSIRVKMVLKDSPADKAGLKRGNRILEILGKPAVEINSKAFRQELGRAIAGEKPIAVKYADNQNTVVETVMTRSRISPPCIHMSKIFTVGDKQVGYLVYNRFYAPFLSQLFGTSELDVVFAGFKENGVSELILDLRYNPGGEVLEAARLASFIAGGATSGKVFARLIHNDKHQDSNINVNLWREANALDLKRVIVIVSGETCSASELLVNGLKPYVEVVTVGARTCGKPVGSKVEFYRDAGIILINFKLLNALNEGDYFSGIAPTFAVRDDLTRELGDEEEACLKEALSYITQGRSSAFPGSFAL